MRCPLLSDPIMWRIPLLSLLLLTLGACGGTHSAPVTRRLDGEIADVKPDERKP